MSKTTRWITVLLGFVLLRLITMLIRWNVADTDNYSAQPTVNLGEPTYQSEFTTTVVYNSSGGIHYKLVADHVNHFAKQQLTWFIRPVATTFDENNMPTWQVKADKAKIIEDKILYLSGHVQVDSLTDASQLKYIKTDQAVVNLITQDVFSNEKVTLYGTSCNSTGMKLRSNLRSKTAELIEQVETFYEIQNDTP
ncbi:LPS export ABC transporter periplasmic protein LptC [Candidatus Hoaglandella endobia]|uniref:Lipopolysaccharide export system protein LptC n=1 Tax=Candidatus Hoaglandella endobia TaxID=1778263 RepID=A0A143WTD2_9ENTR|nr:LPS export ABC transporter periplasmic protein LptC [Candidatus Hoaglandella endobia]CUX97020.1 Lipopolysaccharide export system protein LptC [Candidatus Hoaglandella endobia]